MARYSRQIRFAEFGPDAQERLGSSKVLLCGCGALGSAIANLLVRAGIGFLRIVDRDFVEITNLQRQILFDEEDAAQGMPKVEAAARKLRRINSDVAIEPVIADLSSRNVRELCDGVDIILDGADNFETRYLLNDFACERGMPWVYGGCIGSTGLVMPIIPGATPCLRCVLEEPPGPGGETCDTAGILGPAAMIVASIQVTEAFKILIGRTDRLIPGMAAIDIWHFGVRVVKLGSLREQRECPTCKLKRFEFLDRERTSRTVKLCGRNAVQVHPNSTGQNLPEGSWSSLEARIKEVARKAISNPFLLRFEVDEFEITLFRDGRAIIKGTEEESVARTIYARFVGT